MSIKPLAANRHFLTMNAPSIKTLLSSCFVIFAAAPAAGEPLALKLVDTDSAKLRIFQLRDDKGHGLDCLDVFQPAHDSSKSYYGVSHSLKKGAFSVHLSRSSDLKKWIHIRELDRHGSQATVHKTENGAFLMAYEKDAPNSCWLRLRHYPDLTALTAGKFDREFDIPRSLAPTAEGTPSFENVEMKNGDLTQSKITLRFHAYENAQVDQLAKGTLTNFKNWKASPSPKINTALKKLGGNGNLGDRSKFAWHNQTYYLQEVQGTRSDWGSWGIFLCDNDGFPLKRIAPITPGKSTAFSNPSVSALKDQKGNDLLVFTAFLHRKGSAPNEAGQMLLAFPVR
ncbi:MAG: hypothetical protein ACJAVK_000938 [Akkermansiaceae bacterium]|jgi:hypothetical protein